MDRDDRRRLPGREHRIDRRRDLVSVRRPEARAAAVISRSSASALPGTIAPSERAHDQGRIVQAAIRVDDQARIGRQHGRRAERGRERAGHVRGADVIGDVPFERRARQSERPVIGRDGVVRVIANDQRPRVERAWKRFERRKPARRGFGIEMR